MVRGRLTRPAELMVQVRLTHPAELTVRLPPSRLLMAAQIPAEPITVSMMRDHGLSGGWLH
jgi:hypothetical protein